MENNQCKVQGTIIIIGNTEQKSEKFSVRQFVVKTQGKFQETIPMQCVNMGCDMLNVFKVGQDITADCSLRGREWQGKYFMNLQANNIYLTNGYASETSAIESARPAVDKMVNNILPEPTRRTQPIDVSQPAPTEDFSDLPF
jgi:hypothetical protein